MKSIAITSGKGGVGKTNVAVNLGLSLAAKGKRVLLLDADLGLANVDILFGYSTRRNVADVLQGNLHLRDVMFEAAAGLQVLPASSGVLGLEHPSRAQLTKLAGQLDELADGFDVLLLDTGAGIRDTVLFFSGAAGEILIVTTPEPTAITDAYAMIKVLIQNDGATSIQVLVNEAVDAREGAAVFDKLSRVATGHLGFQPGYAGWIAKDARLEAAVRKRRPVVLRYPACPSARRFDELAKAFDRTFTRSARPLVAGFWEEILSRRKADPVNP